MDANKKDEAKNLKSEEVIFVPEYDYDYSEYERILKEKWDNDTY